MATQSKAQLLNEVHTLLKKRYKPKPDRNNGRLTVLEAVVWVGYVAVVLTLFLRPQRRTVATAPAATPTTAGTV